MLCKLKNRIEEWSEYSWICDSDTGRMPLIFILLVLSISASAYHAKTKPIMPPFGIMNDGRDIDGVVVSQKS